MSATSGDIPVSTVPAVKKYIFDGIKDKVISLAGTGYPEPLVVYDAPGRYRPNDLIAVGQVSQRIVTPLAMVGSGGRGWLREDYELEIVSDVWRPGENLQIEAFERAYQLNAVAEEVIREDPSLGGLVRKASPYYLQDSSGWEREHKGWVVSVVHRIKIFAQI